MVKYHINKHGVPALCYAKPGNCPLGGDETHFNNVGDAQVYANKVNEDSHGILPTVEIPENIEGDLNDWRNISPDETDVYINTGKIKGFDSEFINESVFAEGVSKSLENNFKTDLYPEKRKYINGKTKDLIRILRGDVKSNEENFVNDEAIRETNDRAKEYYNSTMSEKEIILDVLDKNYTPEELSSVNPDDYEIHVIPITSKNKEMLGELNFMVARKNDEPVINNPIVDSQALFVNTYNNEKVDGSRYSSNHDHYSSATVSRLTTDMKQWRRDALNTKDYPDDQQIVDKYGPALGRDALPIKQIRDRVSNLQ